MLLKVRPADMRHANARAEVKQIAAIQYAVQIGRSGRGFVGGLAMQRVQRKRIGWGIYLPALSAAHLQYQGVLLIPVQFETIVSAPRRIQVCRRSRMESSL